LLKPGEIFVTKGTGRPGQGLKLNPEGAFFLGLAIEVERLSVVVVNLHDQIVSHEKVPLENSNDVPSVIRAAAKIVKEIVTKRFKNSPRIRGAGFTIPGMLSQDGIVRLAPLLKWKDVPFREELAKRIQIPIFIENDANAAALAEEFFLRSEMLV